MSIKIKIIKESKNKRDFLNEGDFWDWATNSGDYDEEQRRRDREETERTILKNKQLEREFIEEQKKMDLMMEIERLKALQEEEDREKRKIAAKLQGK